jgi:hypothetical protein
MFVERGMERKFLSDAYSEHNHRCNMHSAQANNRRFFFEQIVLDVICPAGNYRRREMRIELGDCDSKVELPIWKAINGHILMTGQSGLGLKHHIAQNYPGQVVQLSEEERQQVSKVRQLEIAKKEALGAKRLRAVCEAYWSETELGGGHFAGMHDVVVDVLGIQPSNDQLRALLFMLPTHIIGKGIAYGFGDTEVADAIYEFIEENKEEVLNCLLPNR